MPKKLKSSSNTNSVEVRVDVPLTKSAFMSAILILLIGIIGYSGYLGVNSIWKFTHPQFNISLDAFKSLGYIAKGTEIPPIAGPTISVGYDIPEENTSMFLESFKSFKDEFRLKYPDSKLLTIPDNDILNLAWSLCKANERLLSEDGNFDQSKAIVALKAKYVLRYFQIDGLSEYLDGIAEKTFLTLCGD